MGMKRKAFNNVVELESLPDVYRGLVSKVSWFSKAAKPTGSHPQLEKISSATDFVNVVHVLSSLFKISSIDALHHFMQNSANAKVMHMFIPTFQAKGWVSVLESNEVLGASLSRQKVKDVTLENAVVLLNDPKLNSTSRLAIQKMINPKGTKGVSIYSKWLKFPKGMVLPFDHYFSMALERFGYLFVAACADSGFEGVSRDVFELGLSLNDEFTANHVLNNMEELGVFVGKYPFRELSYKNIPGYVTVYPESGTYQAYSDVDPKLVDELTGSELSTKDRSQQESMLHLLKGASAVLVGKPPYGWSAARFDGMMAKYGCKVTRDFVPGTKPIIFCNPKLEASAKLEKAKSLGCTVISYEVILRALGEFKE
jgi:hypothetical protein